MVFHTKHQQGVGRMSGITIAKVRLQPALALAAVTAVLVAPAQISSPMAQGAGTKNPVPLIQKVIIRGLGGKCLDISKASNKTGANVQLSKCHGKANQRWVFYNNGTIKSMMKSAHKNGYKPCLNVRSDNNVLWPAAAMA
jgi:hypothetical protein